MSGGKEAYSKARSVQILPQVIDVRMSEWMSDHQQTERRPLHAECMSQSIFGDLNIVQVMKLQ